MSLNYILELEKKGEKGFQVKVDSKNWEIDDKVFEITNIYNGEDKQGEPRLPSKSLMESKLNTSVDMSQHVEKIYFLSSLFILTIYINAILFSFSYWFLT